jgi:hypothetical protein
MKKLALPAYPLRGVHLVTVWAYAVSQPIFSLLEANPEFLVVRGSSRTEVVLFGLLLVFVPPLVALACELVVLQVSARAADLLHLAFLGAFVSPLALQLVKHIDPGGVVAILGAATLAILAVLVYARVRAVRLFLTFSLALPLVGLYSFIVAVPLAESADVAGANVRVPGRTPVVLVVLDEFPVTSLMAADGEIDAVRYPNFARLGREGTWYRGASTVHDQTAHAVPAILDGKLPDPSELPTVRDHPDNLFTLLGESYEIRSFEPLTHLCPRRYCKSGDEGSLSERMRSLFSDIRIAYLHRTLPDSLAGGLPAIDDRWGGFGDDALGHGDGDGDLILTADDDAEVFRVVRGAFAERDAWTDFEPFVSSIDRRGRPRTLHFLHFLLPHSPWYSLPSGRQYGNAPTDGLDGDTWGGDRWPIQQGLQRHLLQVAYTDRLVGMLLARLEDAGLYDEALVVVTADHGASFIPGGARRAVNRENLSDIARVPLFVKLPGQRKGGVDDRAARTIDILPTIADALRVELPWAVDGRSLLDRDRSRARMVTVWSRAGTVVEASPAEVESRLRDTLRRQSLFFGDGIDGLYEIGIHTDLLGVPVTTAVESSTTRVGFDRGHLLENVRLSSGFIPAWVSGSVGGTAIGKDVELAVSVNGRIAALTRPFFRGEEQRFSALVPERFFREGTNRVQLVAIEGTRADPRLIRLRATSPSER